MSLPFERQKNENFKEYKLRLYRNRKIYGLSLQGVGELLNKDSGENFSESKYRKWYVPYEEGFNDGVKSVTSTNTLEELGENITDSDDIPIGYKETIEILADGVQRSDKLVKMSEEQLKDSECLLEAHGYNPREWEIASAKSSMWNQHNKKDGAMVLYSSKITVKPRTGGFSFEKLLEEIRNNTKPVYMESKYEHLDDKRLLEIPFFDSHFGISDYEYYKQTQEDTIQLIQSRRWEEILFIVGQDMLHNDNFKGQTANGTIIETVDMAKAWRDAKQFYYPIIDKAIEKSNRVKVVYSKGNHDESMSWSFVQMLMERYPQIDFDDDFEERKCHTFGDIFIGITHGDKARKNIHNLFQVEFPMEWAKATIREIHCGHIHTEDAKDWFGMMVRTLATRNKTDKWHKDNGFVGNHKRFMVFEYTEKSLKSIHYV